MKRLLGNLQTQFVRRLETQLAEVSDLCLTVGAKDTDLLREMSATARVEFLPAGIDVAHYAFQPVSESKNLLFMASSYKWHANSDSVEWLHNEIMPRIWAKHPETVLYITGAEHTPNMLKWASDPRIVLTGWVSDEREIARTCSVVVVPMRLGGGIKLKVLTAFAMGKAVITTSQGAEGVAGMLDGTHCLVRDDAQSFADAVADVLANDSLRQSLAENGRRLVCERYDWNYISGRFEALLQSLLIRRGQFPLATTSGATS
jgi:glycosyltransferase involved in cell wall biosynthesis